MKHIDVSLLLLTIMRMKNFNWFLFTLLIFTFSSLSAQQTEYPKTIFRAPVDIPMYLAGNFGEIRSNHFHAGIDIKTNQVEGLNVFAAADGYVSRIKISLYGYGKAIYVTHPNGYTTVYAHLQQFNPEIEAYVKERQYQQQSFEIELYPSANELQVSQGDIIALSGNTGGSGGPHLHFEIRDTRTSVPLNPLLFGFGIKDQIKPILKTLSIYPMNDTTVINGKTEPLHLTLRGQNGAYSVPGPLNITARGVVGVGLEAIDRLNGVPNRCGVYSIELFVDEQKHYSHYMEKIPFELSRYINCHVDFYETKKNKRRIQKSYLDPNNKLDIYRDVKLNGKIFCTEYGHDLRYVVNDAYGNQSTVGITINPDSVTPSMKKVNDGILFAYNKENSFKNEDVQIFIPAYSLYKNEYFNYKQEKQRPPYLTPIHYFNDWYMALQQYAQVKINIESIPTNLRNKLYAVSIDEDGKVLSPEGGTAMGNWLSFRTRSFGPYSVMVDTIAPIIKLKKNFSTNPQEGDQITFEIKDDESGINTYNGYINEQWILMEYDRKTKELWYVLDEQRVSPEAQELKVVITDAVGNTKTWNTKLNW